MPSTTSSPTAEDVPVVCHIGSCAAAPSLSSYVLKLETYLRMCEIPYKLEFGTKLSSKGKMPYIKTDGKEIADTNFIIPYLNKKYEKDLDASLSAQEKAVSLAFKRLVEENTYWTLVYYRWIDNYTAFAKLLPITGFKKRLFPIVSAVSLKPSVRSNLHGHGIGRHSKEEIYEIMEQDLKALSEYLGDKQYFMGAEPTEIDASLFGFLAECLIIPDAPHDKAIREKFPNLLHYTEKMRERYWSNWEECCFKEKKKEEEQGEKKEKKENGADEQAKDGDAAEKVEEKEENGTEQAAAGDAEQTTKEEEPQKPEVSEQSPEEQNEAAAPEK